MVITETQNPISRAMNMLLRAESTWPQIAQEEGGLKEAILPYYIIVGCIPGLIGTVLSMTLWGMFGMVFGGMHAASGMTSALLGGILHFAYGALAILVAGKMVELVAPSFGLQKSWVLSTRAIVYGSTPAYVGAAIFWIPVLGWLASFVCMIWSFLLTLRGFKTLLAKPK